MLIVDADARVLAALRTTIGSEPDLDVVGALSGAQVARDIAAVAGPVVALIDVPEPDDGAALALVRLLSRMPGCRVVVMSLRGGVRVAARRAGAAAFVVKGEDVDAMLSAVREAAAPTA